MAWRRAAFRRFFDEKVCAMVNGRPAIHPLLRPRGPGGVHSLLAQALGILAEKEVIGRGVRLFGGSDAGANATRTAIEVFCKNDLGAFARLVDNMEARMVAGEDPELVRASVRMAQDVKEQAVGLAERLANSA